MRLLRSFTVPLVKMPRRVVADGAAIDGGCPHYDRAGEPIIATLRSPWSATVLVLIVRVPSLPL